MDLDPSAARAGVGLFAYNDIDSTNAEALRLARAGETGPLWITARTQSAGRGRRGRSWISAAGNLYATLLLTDPSPSDVAPQLSFVAALALYDGIIALAPDLKPWVNLKWPNDVLCEARKVAGILVEGEGTPLVVAIGMGVNCAHHPEDTDYPATDLRASNASISAENLFCALSGTMMRRLAQWDRGQGFDVIRQDWLVHASGIGDDIRVQLSDRQLTGRFEALDKAGRLILRLSENCVETISAGDLFPIARVSSGVTAAAFDDDAKQ
jgi:BirA family transcriptional regulator, biotin operon repressor / biotin---[acetyl-CoA-carboxylase] ligase